MEKYIYLIITVGAATVIVGSIFTAYQLFLLVKADASCRGLKHPRFWGLLATSGNNSSGLIMYLIGRRKYPVISMTNEQKSFIERCKKKIRVGIIFLVTGAVICFWGIIFV